MKQTIQKDIVFLKKDLAAAIDARTAANEKIASLKARKQEMESSLPRLRSDLEFSAGAVRKVLEESVMSRRKMCVTAH